MAQFNPNLPIGYQAQMGYPWQQPMYNPMQAIQQMQQPIQQAQPMQQPQAMSRPTVHADIIQVEDEKEGRSINLAPGQRQMMINRPETEIYVKEAYQNGPDSFDVFVKRPPAPPAPEIDPAQFVTWEGLGKRLEAMQSKKKTAKTEEAAE